MLILFFFNYFRILLHTVPRASVKRRKKGPGRPTGSKKKNEPEDEEEEEEEEDEDEEEEEEDEE